MKTILLIENGSRHTLAFAHRLKQYDVRRIQYWNLTSGDIDAADIIILSGGHPSVLHHHWFYRRQLELIQSTTKPIIGICLGFELIVRAYGGRLYRLKRKSHGLRAITVILDTLGLGVSSLKVWEAHKWAVSSVPDETFFVIAESANGAEIIQHKTRSIFGCQFHPEVVDPSNDGSKVLEAILKMIESV